MPRRFELHPFGFSNLPLLRSTGGYHTIQKILTGKSVSLGKSRGSVDYSFADNEPADDKLFGSLFNRRVEAPWSRQRSNQERSARDSDMESSLRANLACRILASWQYRTGGFQGSRSPPHGPPGPQCGLTLDQNCF